jgi:hypothetical protein
MGAPVDYTCPACGYHVEHMVSGLEVGETSQVVGVSCEDCRALRVARVPGKPTELSTRAAAAAVAAGHVPSGARCPHNAKHHVTLWTAPGPCPRCGTTLQPAKPDHRFA